MCLQALARQVLARGKDIAVLSQQLQHVSLRFSSCLIMYVQALARQALARG